MKIGIVQPYFLPYIGYFSLINAVDIFVYFDDVQYIRRGWVNRNRIKINDDWHYLTLPVQKAPQTANINQVYAVQDVQEIEKIKKSIIFSYEQAPNFQAITDLIFNLLEPGLNIATLNIRLTNEICNYLGCKTKTLTSSDIEKNNMLKGQEKIINICQTLNGDSYINPIGGTELYFKERFQQAGIKLNFIEMKQTVYFQGKGDFIPNLSIIDVLMWNSIADIKQMLQEYRLV
jgi:hypothetical protein